MEKYSDMEEYKKVVEIFEDSVAMSGNENAFKEALDELCAKCWAEGLEG